MLFLGNMHDKKENEQALKWYTKGAEAGLPKAMHNYAVYVHEGRCAAAPDYPAAADWYRRAADAGDAESAEPYIRPLLCSTYAPSMECPGWFQ